MTISTTIYLLIVYPTVEAKNTARKLPKVRVEERNSRLYGRVQGNSEEVHGVNPLGNQGLMQESSVKAIQKNKICKSVIGINGLKQFRMN